jgi:hypothetical protein
MAEIDREYISRFLAAKKRAEEANQEPERDYRAALRAQYDRDRAAIKSKTRKQILVGWLIALIFITIGVFLVAGASTVFAQVPDGPPPGNLSGSSGGKSGKDSLTL